MSKEIFKGYLDEKKIPSISSFIFKKPIDSLAKVEYWAVGPKDILDETSIADVVIDHLAQFDGDPPPSVTLWGYARMEAKLERGSTLEIILDYLDTEFGDPDGSNTEPTEEMLDLEAKLHHAVLDGYYVWACEPVIEVTINLEKWMEP